MLFSIKTSCSVPLGSLDRDSSQDARLTGQAGPVGGVVLVLESEPEPESEPESVPESVPGELPA